MKTLISKKLKSGLKFPIKLYDERRNQIYEEESNGYWWKSEFDERGNEIYYEDISGYWRKREFDERGKQIYYEDSKGYWWKSEYDERGNEIYFENSDGTINNRSKEVKEVTMEELEKHFGMKVKVIK